MGRSAALTRRCSDTAASLLQGSCSALLLMLALVPQAAWAANIVVTLPGSVTEINAGSITLSGVSSGPPEAMASNTNISTAAITTNITTLSANALLLDVVGSGNTGSFAPGGSQAEQWDQTSSTATGASSTRTQATAGATSMTQTHSTTSLRNAHAVISLAPAVAAGTVSVAGSAGATAAGVTSLSWNQSLPSAADSKLIVGISIEEGAVCPADSTVSSVTYNGTPMTFIVAEQVTSSSVCMRTELWYADLAVPTVQWRFDEELWDSTAGEVADSISGLNGTAFATTTAAGLVCNAADLSANSAADYLSMDAAAMDGVTDFTISVWGKTAQTGIQALFAGANAGTDNEFIMYFPNATTFTPFLKGSGSGSITIPSIADNNWHHLVWTRSGTQNCIYVDAALQGCSTRSAAALGIDTGGLIFGQEQDSVGGAFNAGQDWEGLVDEPLIFREALVQTEISAIYNNQLAGNDWDGTARVCPGPIPSVAQWRLDEAAWGGTAGEIIDSGGNGYNGVALGAASSNQAPPPPGSAIAGDPGTCGIGVIPANNSAAVIDAVDTGLVVDSDVGNAGTITLWYYSNNDWVGGGNRQIFDAANPSASGGAKYFFLTLFNNGTLRFGLEDSSDGDFLVNSPVQSIAADTWTHIAVSWDLPNNSLVILVNGAVVATLNPATSGALGELGNLLVGDNNGAYIINGATPNSANGGIDEIRVYAQALDAATVLAISAETHACPVVPVPIVEWRLDEALWNGTSGEVVDSISGLNGTAFNATTTIGLVCNAGDLTADSITDYLSFDSAALNGRTDFTLSVWGKTAASGTQTLFSGANAGQNNELIMYFPNATTFTPYLKGDGTGSISIANIADDQWHHLVWTRSGGQNCFYVDNVLQGCSSKSAAALSIAAGGLVLGQDQDNVGGGFQLNQDWEGLVDEPLILDVPLTQTDVTSIYNNQRAGKGWDGTSRTCVAPGPNHYSIAHGGTGVTCLSENVTITSHDASHGAFAPGALTLNLSTSTGKGDWVGVASGSGTLTDPVAGDGLASYSLPAGESAVVLRLNYTDIGAGNAETFSINVSDGSVSENSGNATPAQDDPDMTVSLTGLIFNNIRTQISGKDSNVAPATVVGVRAVRASDNNAAVCDPLLANQSYDVEFGAECRNPATCNGGQTSINGTLIATNDDNAAALTTSYGVVNLPFNAVGDSRFVFNYSDAGQLQLHARFNIPLDDGSGLPSGDYALGSSNNFVVKPAGLCVATPDANADCVSGDASCSRFKRAGEAFNLTVSGVAWEAAGEANTDFCSGNNVTPNFRLGNIALTPNLVAPNPGTNTGLGDTSVNIAAADMGSHTTATQSSSEVGVFSITATPPAYFGNRIPASTSANIGRFYPDRFELSMGTVNEACASGVFSYLDQDFSVDYRLTARNTGGLVTANYRNGFIKLNTGLGTVAYGAVDQGAAVALTGRLSNAADTFNWNNDGTGDLAAQLNLARLAGPDGPFAADIGVLPSDADSVTIAAADLDLDADLNASADHRLIGQSTQRYGRLFIDNAYGPEVLDLSLPVKAEFWNNTAFIVNMLDSCTALTDAPAPGGAPADPDSWGDFELSAYTDSLAPGETTPGFSAIVNGIGAVDLSAPGAGNVGAVRIDVHGPAWLQFDYDFNAVTPDEDAHAEATFGQYRGNDRVIYWRELIPVQ